jgi:microcin C transport system substrate-binding protein
MIRACAAVCACLLAFAVSAPAAGDELPRRHGIAMYGDPKYGPEFKHFDYVNPNAPKGGTVKLANIGGFDSFNAFIIRGTPAPGIGGIYDTLTEASADEAFTRYGLLAESMEMPEDRSWITFHLRPEARWHDGRPVTADDVIFTFEVQLKQGTPQFRLYYASVDRVEKLDERSVKFVFKPGINRELPLIVSEMVVLPKHYWEGRDFSKPTLEPPLGSGPYRVKAFEAGRWVIYERVKDYWGAHVPVRVGQQNFGEIQYDSYRDRSVQLEAFKAGAFDFRVESSAKDWATQYDIPEVASGALVKELIPNDRTAGMQSYAYNLRRPIFQDKRVRQALAYAFDFERSNAIFFYGQYTRTRSFFDNSELAATGLPSPRELEILEPYRGKVPPEVFSREYNPPKVVDGRIRPNLKKAVELLQEAGWEFRGTQLANSKTGEPFRFEILLYESTFERITLPFIKNLERLGIEARVRTVDVPQYIKRLETFDFDMVIGSWGQSLSPGNEQRSYWGSEAAEHPGSRNWVGIKDPVIDEVIEKLIASPDRESLVAHVRVLDRLLQWGHYVIPQWHMEGDRVAYWNKFGRPAVTPLQGVQFEAWWVDPAKASSLRLARH